MPSLSLSGRVAIIAASFLISLSVSFNNAQANTPGSLDTSFNGTGKVTTRIGVFDDRAYAIAIQPDGKIVTSGYAASGGGVVVRYNSDGTLDTTFNGTGMVITGPTDAAYSVAIQPDGKIVAAGFRGYESNQNLALIRYNANGALDTTFGGTGLVITDLGGRYEEIRKVIIEPDGKIVAIGHTDSGTSKYHYFVARYNSDGTLDTTFNSTGIVITAIGSAVDKAYGGALQADGKIVVAGRSDSAATGSDCAILRFNPDGSLDTSFNGTGKVTTDILMLANEADAVTIQPDGKIIASGAGYTGAPASWHFALPRYNTNGTLDTSFNGTGIATTAVSPVEDEAYAIAIQPDGENSGGGIHDRPRFI